MEKFFTLSLSRAKLTVSWLPRYRPLQYPLPAVDSGSEGCARSLRRLAARRLSRWKTRAMPIGRQGGLQCNAF